MSKHKFFYEAIECNTGNKLNGYMLASNEVEVYKQLKLDGYVAVRISYNDLYSFWQNIRGRFANKNLNAQAIIILCRQLSVMLESGMNIIEALENLLNNSKHKAMQDFLQETVSKLREGKNLTAIWQTKVLPPYMISSLTIAETTGILAQTLSEVADYLEQREDERQKLRQICIYPVFLLGILFVIANIMIFWVLPTFAEVFARMNLDLPLLTRLILTVGLCLQQNYLYILFACIFGIGLFWRCFQSRVFKFKCYKFLLSLPIFGDFCEKLYLMRISRQLRFLLMSGISIDEALQIILKSTTNEYMEKALQRVIAHLKQGFSLYSACKRLQLKNYIFAELINVGEQTGMLTKSLQYSDAFFAKELDKFMQNFTKILEPALMIVIGLIVGVFVMAIVLPMFQIANSVAL